jgi:heptosyltransferase-2
MPPNQRILVRGVNWLGDAVMSTPALQRLREARPDAHITLLTHQKLGELWTQHPSVNAVETFASGESAWRIGSRLWAGDFDLALILPNSPRSALESWLAGIPQRIGYARPWRNWFLTHRIPPRPDAVAMHKRSVSEINQLLAEPAAVPDPNYPPAAHHIHQYLHLTGALGANPAPLPPLLSVSGDAVAQFIARFKLAPSAASAQAWFGLNPGAEYGPAKRWPEDRFIKAAVQIQRRVRCRWLVFGIQSERELCDRIAAKICLGAEQSPGGEKDAKDPRALSLAGVTSLGELCAGLKFCRVLLTNDSGPMHVAAALGTPVVVPFGSTSPELTGPGLPGDSHHVCLRAGAPCSPCFLRACPIDFRCMTGITVDSVVEAVLRVAARPDRCD